MALGLGTEEPLSPTGLLGPMHPPESVSAPCLLLVRVPGYHLRERLVGLKGSVKHPARGSLKERPGASANCALHTRLLGGPSRVVIACRIPALQTAASRSYWSPRFPVSFRVPDKTWWVLVT